MERRDKILIYRGVGNSQQVLVRGHYFKKYPIKELRQQQSQIQNLRQAFNRFRLQPHKYRKLDVRVGDDSREVTTGKDGYFESTLAHTGSELGWYKINVSDPENGKEDEGSYFVPDESSPSIISDIDDTVLISHSTRFLRKMRLFLFKNAHSRKITKHVESEDWMSHLLPETEIDSYFYVSSSEWNLYDFLEDFFEIKGLPKGPFFLKRLKTNPLKLLRSGGGHHLHKLDSINFLMGFYPSKPFYLLGDSGQKDIHIYMDVVKQNPGRVKGVLIRKIKLNSRRKILEEASRFFHQNGIPFHAFTDHEIDQINPDIEPSNSLE